MTWKYWNERKLHGIEDNETYLVSYLDDEGEYVLPNRAYYSKYDDKMRLLDAINSFPIACDIYMEMPEVPKKG